MELGPVKRVYDLSLETCPAAYILPFFIVGRLFCATRRIEVGFHGFTEIVAYNTPKLHDIPLY